MDKSKLLLILLGSPPSHYIDEHSISIQDLSLVTLRSPLEISHTPFLDCLAASGANGLVDCWKDSACLSLLMSFASAWSNDDQSGAFTSLPSSSEGDLISQVLNKAIKDLNQGHRVRIVHFEQVQRGERREDKGQTAFAEFVDALHEEVVYTEMIDKLLLTSINQMVGVGTRSGMDLLVCAMHLGSLVSSTPLARSCSDPAPISLAKAGYLFKSLGGSQVLSERAELSSRKPKAKRPAPSSSTTTTAQPSASQDPNAPHRAILSSLHKKAGFNDARRNASWAGRTWIPGLMPRDVFGPYAESWPDPREVRGDAVRSFDELSAARGALGRFETQGLVQLLEAHLSQ